MPAAVRRLRPPVFIALAVLVFQAADLRGYGLQRGPDETNEFACDRDGDLVRWDALGRHSIEAAVQGLKDK